MNVHVAIADDHLLFRKSVGQLIDSFPGFSLVAYACNGRDLLQQIALLTRLPDIVLLDVNMPALDGPATAAILSAKYSKVKMVALSTKNDEATVNSMIRAGCCAYLLKDIHPSDLEKALVQVQQHGYFNADESNTRIRRLLAQKDDVESLVLSEREKTFLKLACSDLTYKQIAVEMNLAERTIDGYREHLFEKLSVQSRVGMVLKALRKGLIKLDDQDDA